jgi:hypothetical protein
MNPGQGESYDKHLTENAALSQKMLWAIDKNLETKSNGLYTDSEFFPFSPGEYDLKTEDVGDTTTGKSYNRKDQAYRRIDGEWLGEFEYLSLYLNTYTNNSSLVLAFEFTDSKKVLLFAADAQTGNWKSWETVKWENPSVSTSKLLSNTVLYKVGHHCSHNATYVKSFEEMTHPELVAMIPVDEANAKAQEWNMPAERLFRKIVDKTNGRVLRMDKGKLRGHTAGWAELPDDHEVKITPLFIDYTLGGL